MYAPVQTAMVSMQTEKHQGQRFASVLPFYVTHNTAEKCSLGPVAAAVYFGKHFNG